jgi:thiol-disulfide isomerase/thioredoxin
MKKILLAIVVLFAVFAVSAQTVIKNPITGMTNAGALRITQIEINSNETVLSFFVEPWMNSFGIAKRSFILIQGKSDSLFMTKQDAPSPGSNGYIAVPPEGMAYKLYFPPIDPNIARIDFGESISSGWYIYDIEIGKQPVRSVVPKELLGNWFADDSKLWEFGFYDSVAVSGMKGWAYKSATEKDGLYTIRLVSDGEERNVFVKKGEGNECWLGTKPDNLKKYSSQFPGTAVMDFSAYKEINSGNIAPDKAIYSGYINKFTTRLGRNTGTIQMFDNITGTTKMFVAKIDRYGLFTVEIPMAYPHEVSIDFPGRRDQVFLEPGKRLFHFINSTQLPAMNLFMGENAGLNNGLLVVRKLEFNEMKFISSILNMTVSDYLQYVREDKARKLLQLEELTRLNNVDKKAYEICKMNIEFRAAINALQSNTYLRLAVLYENQKRNEKDKLPYPIIKLNADDLSFLKGTPVNDPKAISCSEYPALISALKNLDLNNENGATFNLYTNLETALLEKGIPLTPEEKEMLTYIRMYMKGDYSQEVSRNFNQMYSSTLRAFQTKYMDQLQKISSDMMAQNLNVNATQIFGVSDGLLFEVAKTQDYFRKTKEAKPEVLADAYAKVKSEIKTETLKEAIMADYFKKKAESELVASADGVVYKNEADRFFDSLIKKYRGKVVYVDFWATWCSPCREGITRIKPLKEEMKKEDVVFVYITNPTSVEKDYKTMVPDIKGEHFKVTADEWNLLMSKFNIIGIPHYALVGRNGRIVNSNMAHLENEPLKKVLFDELKK